MYFSESVVIVSFDILVNKNGVYGGTKNGDGRTDITGGHWIIYTSLIRILLLAQYLSSLLSIIKKEEMI